MKTMQGSGTPVLRAKGMRSWPDPAFFTVSFNLGNFSQALAILMEGGLASNVSIS